MYCCCYCSIGMHYHQSVSNRLLFVVYCKISILFDSYLWNWIVVTLLFEVISYLREKNRGKFNKKIIMVIINECIIHCYFNYYYFNYYYYYYGVIISLLWCVCRSFGWLKNLQAKFEYQYCCWYNCSHFATLSDKFLAKRKLKFTKNQN